MTFLSDLSPMVTENEPLAPHASLGVGGRARWFARPRDVEDLTEVVRRCWRERVELRLLGLGANLLVSDDGVDGVVVRLNSAEFRRVSWSEDADSARTAGTARAEEVVVTAGAGADMNRLVLDSVRRGLSGLECMAGIPGTLGGIIRMNAGGRFGEIADVVRDVTVVDPYGAVRMMSREEVGFRYRGTDLGACAVCGASLVLRPGDPKAIRARFMEVWAYKRQTQPLTDATAGCVFKNPPGRSAGQLIDRSGLKGRSVGGACVSQHHANFIVAKEGATARDVLSLIGLIRREVAEQFGVELELEIEVWDGRRARSLEPIG